MVGVHIRPRWDGTLLLTLHRESAKSDKMSGMLVDHSAQTRTCTGTVTLDSDSALLKCGRLLWTPHLDKSNPTCAQHTYSVMTSVPTSS